MRDLLFRHFANRTGYHVKCTGASDPAYTSSIKLDRLDYGDYASLLATSNFCFLLPGDTQSSRRLSDAVIAGCLPVFLGPPYHSMPFSKKIRYQDFSILMHIREFENLQRINTIKHGYPPLVASNWQDDFDIQEYAVFTELAKVASILEQNRNIPNMKAEMNKYKYAFLFSDGKTQGTESMILDHLADI